MHSQTGFTIPDSLAYVIGLALAFTAGMLLDHYLWAPQSPSVVATLTPAATPAPEPLPVPAPPPGPAPQPIVAEPAHSEEPQFTLRGVFAASASERSMALIADETGRQTIYRIGQKVGDGYTLTSVGGKDAVVEKNGIEHTLLLKKVALWDQENSELASAGETPQASPPEAAAEPKPESAPVLQTHPEPTTDMPAGAAEAP